MFKPLIHLNNQKKSMNRTYDRLRQDLNKLFDESFFNLSTSASPWMAPSLDVKENDKEIIITAELPGLDENDISIEVNNNVLTLSAEKKQETEDKNEEYHLLERSYGKMRRSLSLPFEVDPQKAEATMVKGVLKIVIPKPEAQKNLHSKIEIKHRD